MMTGTTTNLNKFPFTATQWQELEHQALIYKYMISGIPIPSDLLFNIKRTSCLDSSPIPSKLFARQSPHIGWSCFQMGLGRKIDPEPGRCRRTDGKKWRCSKEAYPDSKYCERHMHRGKNRSRKPVEIGTQTTTTTLPTPNISSSITNKTNLLNPSSHLLSSTDQNQTHHHFQNQQQQLHYPPAYDNSHLNNNNHHFLSSSRSPNIGLSSQDSSFSLSNTDYRNAYGMKEEVDEHAFFSEQSGSGSMRSLSGSSMDDHAWQLTPLTMSSSSTNSTSSNQRNMSGLQNEYPYLQLRSLSDHDHASKQQQKQYNYVHGNMKNERDEPQNKTVHRFFDEWPLKNKDSWLDLDDKSQNSTSVSTTRLSISIPSSSSHDFPNIFNSRTHNDG
ncbi:growth-regulating factor 1-like [Euphorbia lathyris]|uniref:growth-regulating factor 1-like n=1 Tax=Euphorbia lathyris TaxID=212925 RepID=UPI00331371D4